MSMIINPRGASGAGKTEFARRLMARYSWKRGPDEYSAGAEPIRRPGRRLPIGYRLRHPHAGPSLVVLGHYEVTSGGCDTIAAADGGLDEVFRLAQHYAGVGDDVLLEGLSLSREVQRTCELARRHRLHILRLATPLDRSIRNLISRRRARKDTHAHIAHRAGLEDQAVVDACRKLHNCAAVETLPFDAALLRAERLLGVHKEEDR